jgi:hypothetical protein
LGPFHATFFGLHPAKDIAPTDDYGDLNALVNNGLDFSGVLGQSIVVNAKLFLTHQGLSTQFEKDSLVLHCRCEYLNLSVSFFCTVANTTKEKAPIAVGAFL